MTPGQYAQLQRARAALSGSDIADDTQGMIWKHGAHRSLAGEYGQRADAAELGSAQSAIKADAARGVASGHQEEISTLQDFTQPPPSVAPGTQAPQQVAPTMPPQVQGRQSMTPPQGYMSIGTSPPPTPQTQTSAEFQVNEAVEYKGKKYKVHYRLNNGGIVLRSNGVLDADVTVSAADVSQIQKTGQPTVGTQNPQQSASSTPQAQPQAQPQRQAQGPSPTQTTPAAGAPAQQQEPLIPGMTPGAGRAMMGVVPKDAPEKRQEMVKGLESQMEAARKQQAQHASNSMMLNQYSQSQRQTQRDLELTAVGADALVEERISKRKSAAERFKPSQEMADFLILSEQQGVTKEQLKTKLDEVLGRTPSDERVNRVSELMDFYHAHKDVNPTIANLALQGVEDLLKNIGEGGTGTGSSSKKSITKVGSSYHESIKKWESSINNPEKIGNITPSAMVSTHEFFTEAMPHIKSKFSQVDGGWWFFDSNVELGMDEANNAMKTLIQVAKRKGMTPTDFQKIMNHITTIAGKTGNKASKNADDFEKFAVMLHNVKNYAGGSLWRDYSKVISELSRLRTNKDSQFAEMGWLDSTHAYEMNQARWTLPNPEGGPGIPISQWVPGTVKASKAPPSDAGTQEQKPGPPETGQEYTRFNPTTFQFEKVKVESAEYDKGRLKRIKVDGKWQNVGSVHYGEGKAVKIQEYSARDPHGYRKSVYQNMKEGTRIVYKGKEYTFVNTVPHRIGGGIAGIRLKDEQGNVIIVRRQGAHLPDLYFPVGAGLDEINAAISGKEPPNKPRPKQQKRHPAGEATKPISERDGQKKNIPVDNTSDPALTMTWSRLADGKKRVTGEFFNATFVNLIPEGATRRNGKSGVWDSDTVYGITVEVPDNNFDGVLNAEDWVEVDGKRVPLPKAWHTENPDRRYGEFDPKDGTVHMKDAAIRLAGFQGWELKSTDESKDGREARRALLNMFQNGWRDAEDKNRFIFKVRGVGLPLGHKNASKDKRNPYIEPPVLRNGEWQHWGRIVTDVYVVVDGTRKKIGELTFKNPAHDLVKQGHGRYWYPRK